MVPVGAVFLELVMVLAARLQREATRRLQVLVVGAQGQALETEGTGQRVLSMETALGRAAEGEVVLRTVPLPAEVVRSTAAAAADAKALADRERAVLSL